MDERNVVREGGYLRARLPAELWDAERHGSRPTFPRGTATPTAAAARISASHDQLDHWYCDCDPNLSLCGRDLTDVPESDFDEASCVVCEALFDSECPYCGEEPS